MQSIVKTVALVAWGLVPFAVGAQALRLLSDPASLDAKAQKVQVCDQGSPCVVTVSVIAVPAHPKRCTVKLDKPILIVVGAAARTLTWEIDPGGAAEYRFDPKVGIDIAGDDAALPANQEFDEDGVPDESGPRKKFNVGHRKHLGNRNLAYSYTINVQIKHSTVGGGFHWAHCGARDPIIVNRD